MRRRSTALLGSGVFIGTVMGGVSDQHGGDMIAVLLDTLTSQI